MTIMCILGAFFEFVDELPGTNLFSLRMYMYDYIYDMDICMYVETYYQLLNNEKNISWIILFFVRSFKNGCYIWFRSLIIPLQTKVKHENKSELNGVLLLTKKTVVNKLIINTAPKTNQIPQSKSIHFTNTYYVLEMKQQVRNWWRRKKILSELKVVCECEK